MKILWITNIKLPPLSEYLNESIISIGGWMISSLNELRKHTEVDIAVATFDSRKDLLDIKLDGIRYFLVPTRGKNPQKYNKELEKEWNKVNKLFTPDVVHIHGTELPHSLAWVRACGSHNVCVSIQGLVSVCSRYYKTDSWLDYFPLTFRDLVKLDWISKQRRGFKKRGEYEYELLKSVNHIIGRTVWDKSHAWAINPSAKYHFCGETLRPEFYRHKWSYDKCQPYSIFISQGNYPIKGLHKAIEAIGLVIREFPNTVVYVGGSNIMEVPWYRKGGYSVIIKRLIKKFGLKGKIFFTGMLDEQAMCQQYLKSNLFLLPSAIENSPNSLGEAQLLGTPFLATYCGGIPEIVGGNLEKLYRYEETEVLAYKICNIFRNYKEQHDVKKENLYNPTSNIDNLLNIYRTIYNKQS